MSESGETKATEEPGPTKPEFKPNFLLAFVTLLLYKQGGIETIELEWLEKFDPDSGPEAYYDHDKKAWVLRLRKGDRPVIVPVSGKILKSQRRLLRAICKDGKRN